MKLRPLNIKEKKSVPLRIPEDSDISLTACKHAYNYLTKPAHIFFLLSELYGRGSMENKALENEKLSTKHPKGRNRTEHPKSKTKSNPNSKMKHSKLENEASKFENEAPYLPLEDRFDQRQRPNLLLLIRIKIKFLLNIVFLLFLTVSLS